MWLRVPVGAPYPLHDMTLDAVGLLNALGIDSARVVGASMGGSIAQEMALHHPRRVRSLTSIMSTTAARRQLPARGGARPRPCVVTRGLNPAGSARQLAAILASGSRRRALRHVKAPTLVIHGDADPLVALAAGADTANRIPGAELMVLEGIGHALPMPMWPRIIGGVVRIASR